MIASLSVVPHAVARAATSLAAGTCPTAPPGMQDIVDKMTGWAKWAVLAVLAVGFFASVAALVYGRVSHHPKGARLGIEGIGVCIVGAALFSAGYAVITGIAGSGC
jgi:hypothetical protein